MAEVWTTSDCAGEEGFPKVLYAATARLGIPSRPSYLGREFEEHGTKSCEVIVKVEASEKFPEIQPWSMTATGCRLKDTYQLAARKALLCLCQMFEWHLDDTPMRYFPPQDRSRPSWAAKVKTLERLDGSTVTSLTSYLLALDALCDIQLRRVRGLVKRAEKAERRWHSCQVALAEAQARAARADSQVLALRNDLRKQADKHSQLLRGVLLVDRAKKRKHPRLPEGEPLEGIPLLRCTTATTACPPTPVSSPTAVSGRSGQGGRQLDVNQPAATTADP